MSKRKILMLLMVATILLGSIFSNFGSIEVQGATDLNTKLKDNLIPLKTTIAENGFDDLQPLKEILKDKKVIGLGESTLGAKEFYEIKHRIVEFLVEEMGYRIFAIDAEFADVEAVNDYIFNDGGNIEDAIWSIRHITWSLSQVKEEISEIKYIISALSLPNS